MMKDKFKIFTKGTAGITLIALVLTIVVLLILAAVSISMLGGENGIVKQAQESKKKNAIAEEKEKIQLSVNNIIIEKNFINEQAKVTKQELENALMTEIDNVTVSDKRPGEEYQYIVQVNENQYGIKDNNEVEYFEGGILNKYIYVTYVNEEAPKYLFENTITQEDLDKEVNGKRVSYTIMGVSNEENGEYITEGTITGKSGELNIKDLQNTIFEYTLTDFFDGDDVFYVKIQIENSIEKIQKLTVVQGDEVKYEENFGGIVYTGTWFDLENEKYSGGSVKYSDTSGNNAKVKGIGSAFDLIYPLHEDGGVAAIIALNAQDGKLLRFFQVGFRVSETQYNEFLSNVLGYIWFDQSAHTQKQYEITLQQMKMNSTSQPGEERFYLDAIVIYR